MNDGDRSGGGNRAPGNASQGNATRCLAVMRGTQHAAKHVSNDSLMFHLVCDGLRELGWSVECVPEGNLAEALEKEGRPDCIISMAQRPDNVELLRRAALGGLRVVNAPAAVTNCYRTALVEILQDSEVPFGRTCLLDVAAPPGFPEVASALGSPFWLKRGDIHAAHQEDVCRVESGEEYERALAGFRRRGVGTVVAQEHLPGDVVKFYAVRGTNFFHAQYFETEGDVAFDTEPLHAIADAAAALAGLDIYGGDVVMTPSGPVLIDLNAWPSFGRVREAAAPKMVEAIVRGLSIDDCRMANQGGSGK